MSTSPLKTWYSFDQNLSARLRIYRKNEERDNCIVLEIDDFNKLCEIRKTSPKAFMEKAESFGYKLSATTSNKLELLYLGYVDDTTPAGTRKVNTKHLKDLLGNVYQVDQPLNDIFKEYDESLESKAFWREQLADFVISNGRPVYRLANDGQGFNNFETYHFKIKTGAVSPHFQSHINDNILPFPHLQNMGYDATKSVITYYPSQLAALNAGVKEDQLEEVYLHQNNFPFFVSDDGRIHAFRNVLHVPEVVSHIGSDKEHFTKNLQIANTINAVLDYTNTIHNAHNSFKILSSEFDTSTGSRNKLMDDFSDVLNLTNSTYEKLAQFTGVNNLDKYELAKQDASWYVSTNGKAPTLLDQSSIKSVFDNLSAKSTSISNAKTSLAEPVRSVGQYIDVINEVVFKHHFEERSLRISKQLESAIGPSDQFKLVDDVIAISPSTLINQGSGVTPEIQALHEYYQILKLGLIPHNSNLSAAADIRFKNASNQMAQYTANKIEYAANNNVDAEAIFGSPIPFASARISAMVDSFKAKMDGYGLQEQLNNVIELRSQYFKQEYVEQLVLNEQVFDQASDVEQLIKEALQSGLERGADILPKHEIVENIRRNNTTQALGQLTVDQDIYNLEERKTSIFLSDPLFKEQAIQLNKADDSALSNFVLPDVLFQKLSEISDSLSRSVNEIADLPLIERHTPRSLHHVATQLDELNTIIHPQFINNIFKDDTASLTLINNLIANNRRDEPIVGEFGYTDQLQSLKAIKAISAYLPTQLGDHPKLDHLINENLGLNTHISFLQNERINFKSSPLYLMGQAQHFVNQFVPSNLNSSPLYAEDGTFVIADIGRDRPFAIEKLFGERLNELELADYEKADGNVLEEKALKILSGSTIDEVVDEAYLFYKKASVYNASGLTHLDRLTSYKIIDMVQAGNVQSFDQRVFQDYFKTNSEFSANDFGIGDWTYHQKNLTSISPAGNSFVSKNRKEFSEFITKTILINAELQAADPKALRSDNDNAVNPNINKHFTVDAEFKMIWEYNKPNRLELANKFTNTSTEALLMNTNQAIEGGLQQLTTHAAFMNVGREFDGDYKDQIIPLVVTQQDVTMVRYIPSMIAQVTKRLDAIVEQGDRYLPNTTKKEVAFADPIYNIYDNNRMHFNLGELREKAKKHEMPSTLAKQDNNGSHPKPNYVGVSHFNGLANAAIAALSEDDLHNWAKSELASKEGNNTSMTMSVYINKDHTASIVPSYQHAEAGSRKVGDLKFNDFFSSTYSADNEFDRQVVGDLIRMKSLDLTSNPDVKALVNPDAVITLLMRDKAKHPTNYNEAIVDSIGNTEVVRDKFTDGQRIANKALATMQVVNSDSLIDLYKNEAAASYGVNDHDKLTHAFAVEHRRMGGMQIVYPESNVKDLASDHTFKVTTIEMPLDQFEILDRLPSQAIQAVIRSGYEALAPMSDKVKPIVEFETDKKALLKVSKDVNQMIMGVVYNHGDSTSFPLIHKLNSDSIIAMVNPETIHQGEGFEFLSKNDIGVHEKLRNGWKIASLPSSSETKSLLTTAINSLNVVEHSFEFKNIDFVEILEVDLPIPEAPEVESPEQPKPVAVSTPTPTTEVTEEPKLEQPKQTELDTEQKRQSRSSKSAKQPNEIVDVGLKLPGAVKDQFNATLSFEQIKEKTQEELINLVKLSKIWPKSNVVELQKDGMTAACYMMHQGLKRLFPEKPSIPRDVISSDSLKICYAAYNKLATDIRDAISDKRTVKDTQLALAQVTREWGQPHNVALLKPAVQLYGDVFMALKRATDNVVTIKEKYPNNPEIQDRELSQFSPPSDMYNKIRSFTHNNKAFKEKFEYRALDIRPHYKYVQTLDDKLSDDVQKRFFYAFSPTGTIDPHNPEATIVKKPKASTYDVAKEINKLLAKQKDSVNDYAADRSELRECMSDRNGRDVTAKELQDRFGFKSIEFGNYVNQKTRQADLNFAYDGCATLAKMLGVQDRFISFDGHVSLSNGSRGRGGNAAAHYEPSTGVMNLTRDSGFGSFGHEWMHGLDHHLMKIEMKQNPNIRISEKGYLMSTYVTDTYTSNNVKPEGMFKTMESMVDNMRKGAFYNLTINQAVPLFEQKEKEALKNVEEIIKTITHFSEPFGKLVSERFDEWKKAPSRNYEIYEKMSVNGASENPVAEIKLSIHKGLGGAISNDIRHCKDDFINGVMRDKVRSHPDLEVRYQMAKVHDSGITDMLRDTMTYIEIVRYAKTVLPDFQKACSDYCKNEANNKALLDTFIIKTGCNELRNSEFHNDARFFDAGKTNAYFSTPHEEFARTGEAILVEMLNKHKQTNDWLVRPDSQKIAAYGSRSVRPYAEERDRIVEYFDTKFLPPAIDRIMTTLPEMRQQDIVRDLQRDLNYLINTKSLIALDHEIKQIEDNLAKAKSPEFLNALIKRDADINAAYERGEQPVIDRNDNGLFTYTDKLREVREDEFATAKADVKSDKISRNDSGNALEI